MKKIISLLLVMVLTMPGLAGCGILEKLCSHTFDELETLSSKPATCSESGLTEGKKCALCGKIIIEQEELSPLGHIYEYTSEFDEEGNRVNVAICERENCTERKIVTDKERLIGEWRNAAGVYEGDIEITINYYVHRIGDDIRPTLPFKLSNGSIYIFDDLYDEVECILNPNISFDGVLITNEDKIVHGEKVSDTIAKLEKCDECYVLRTDDNPRWHAGKIYVYQLDGYFYFILFRGIDDQWADRMNYTNFKDGV
jgi:hypothetical protein